MAQRPKPVWAQPPQHTWSIDEIKLGNVISTYSLNDIINKNSSKLSSNTCTFGRIADNPSLVDIVTAHESASRVHARIAFDNNDTPWLKCLGSANGTFVNEKRLPPEACGKEDNNSNRKGSRGVVLYPGDALRFGASTRLYILEGPEEYERGAIKLKQKMKTEESAMAAHSANGDGDDEEGGTAKSNDASCSWGMSDDIDTTADETEQQAAHPTAHDDNSNLPPLPSIEQFFYAPDGKYKITQPLYQLHSTYNTKTNKLQAIQKESSRIMAKENMGLTDGQQAQLNKNRERMTTLEKEINNLKNRIEDGMHNAIHGGQRKVKKRQKEKSQYDENDDIDDFYDRTASSSKRQRTEDMNADSEESLLAKWKKLIAEQTKQQQMVSRALERCTTLQQQIDSSKEDDDAFFIQNDLDLTNENLSKAQKAIEETDKELDNVEYLLKIVNPKLEWDRENGLIGFDIAQMRNAVVKVPIAGDSVMPRQSLTMPPPPSISANPKSLMPPPPSTTAETLEMPPPPPSKAVMLEQEMMPPPNTVDNKSNDVQSSMPPPPKVNKDVKPQKKMHIGPRRPPSNIQGTLAALTQTSSVSESRTGATSTDSQQKKKTQVISNPKEDLWKAPADQDGSGRTALNDKFKGRY